MRLNPRHQRSGWHVAVGAAAVKLKNDDPALEVERQEIDDVLFVQAQQWPQPNDRIPDASLDSECLVAPHAPKLGRGRAKVHPRRLEHPCAHVIEAARDQRASRSGVAATAELTREPIDVDIARAAE